MFEGDFVLNCEKFMKPEFTSSKIGFLCYNELGLLCITVFCRCNYKKLYDRSKPFIYVRKECPQGLRYIMSYSRESFLNLLETSVSPYHTVLAAEERLAKAGFEKLDSQGKWNLKEGNSYYVTYDGSTLFAFVLGQRFAGTKALRMAEAHTDFPCLVIKQNPDVKAGGCQQLNVEVYGGPILSTWLDRPLSAAGQVVVRSEDPWKPQVQYVDLEKPFCVIPNLAIHMNREVNKGVALNKQTDMLPVAGLCDGTADQAGFLSYLAAHMGVKAEDILDYSLYLYATEKPEMLGMNQELVSACHLDDTTGVQAVLDGIIACSEENDMAGCFNCATASVEGIRMAALFDHEEIGSRTKQGACSTLLRSVLAKIAACDSLKSEFWAESPTVEQLLEDAMLLSVDVGHASHPNHMGKMDPTNHPVLGKGFCIKKACAQSYVTDSASISIVEQLCDKNQIPWQMFMNRADEAGGSTLGAVGAGFLPVPAVDLGVPILAMHSARELMAEADMKALSDFVEVFFIK